MKEIINITWFLLRLFQHRNLDGGPRVSKEIKDERLSLCQNCPKLDITGFLAKLKGPRCSHCGCFIHWKILYKVEECPNNPPFWSNEI